MVLRKPYAFLIKHFKIIHLILCIPLVYLIIKTGAITSFFSDYVKANYYTNLTNIAGSYINYFMYLAILVILLLVLAVYFLMRQKKKNSKFYLFLMLYYLLLFVLFTMCHGIMGKMETNEITAQVVRSYRDIAYMVYVPQFYFFIITVLRGIGFNIKKFNFDEDAKELEIDDYDNEEFELEIGKNAYLYERKIRRVIREFKYYILENKVVFTILVSIIGVIFGTLLYLNFNVYNKKYHQTQKINHNGLTVSVTDSILTNMDQGGNIITKGKIYLAVAVKITNSKNIENTFDYENFQADVNGSLIRATLDKSDDFPDLGLAYARDTKIPPNSENTYVLTYEMNEDDQNKKITLKILDSLDVTIGSVTSNYKTVNLKYDKAFDTTEKKTLEFGQTLALSETRLNMVKIQLNSASLKNAYEYTYKSCVYSICQDLKNKIVAKNSQNTLLILDRNFELDTYTNYYKARKGTSFFVSDFLKLEYTLNDTKKEVILINRSTKDLANTWIFEIPKEITNASDIYLLVNLRGSIYKLKVQIS